MSDLLFQEILNRLDKLQEDVSSLKETRAEQKGIVKMAIVAATGISGAISFLFNHFK